MPTLVSPPHEMAARNAFLAYFQKATAKMLTNEPSLSAPLLPVEKEVVGFEYSQDDTVHYWTEFLYAEQSAEVINYNFVDGFGLTVTKIDKKVF